MNKKILLGTSFAAIFVASMMMLPISIDAAHGSHLDIVNSKFKVKKGIVSAFVITADKIPIDGSAGAFGYGLITGFDENGQPENVLALTTHLCAADSFVQGDATEEECPVTVVFLIF